MLVVRGADLMDGTPVLDIKPYLPYADRIDGATGGFTDENEKRKLTVVFPQPLKEKIDPDKIKALYGVLEQDPRPSYQQDDGRVYGVSFSGWNVRFLVSSLELTVVEVEKI